VENGRFYLAFGQGERITTVNTSKYILIVTTLILLGSLYTSAAAQTIGPPVAGETTVNLKLSAVESSDGILGFDPKVGETMFGYGFLGQTTGDFPGSFTFSMNCAPAFFVAGQTNSITGGSWSLPVYMQPPKGFNVVYVGSLYGQIVEGKMAWEKESTLVSLAFNVEGGTQTWAGVKGHGSFQGSLVKDEKGATTLNGELTITYSTPR
jgi:hypothetical protein